MHAEPGTTGPDEGIIEWTRDLFDLAHPTFLGHVAALALGVVGLTLGDSKLEVATGIVAQQGDVHLSHIIELNREILSGKIR